jgi:hypothetical protein
MTHSPDHAERAREATIAVLVSLTESGVPTDVLEMLTHGDGRGTIPPKVLEKAIAAALRRRDRVVEEAIVPPVNGEPDPEWAVIRRAIDQFAGRVPTISKHRALHNTHLAAVVARLDAAGDREAADTIVWQCWYRALDRERERFLLEDARAALHDAAHLQQNGEGEARDGAGA